MMAMENAPHTHERQPGKLIFRLMSAHAGTCCFTDEEKHRLIMAAHLRGHMIDRHQSLVGLGAACRGGEGDRCVRMKTSGEQAIPNPGKPGAGHVDDEVRALPADGGEIAYIHLSQGLTMGDQALSGDPSIVSAMPASLAAAIPAVTPGTTVTAMPASISASRSSPPRPKIMGSPHLRRSTRSPALARSIHHLVDAVLRPAFAARRLADGDDLGIASDTVQDGVGNETIMQNHVAALHQTNGPGGHHYPQFRVIIDPIGRDRH